MSTIVGAAHDLDLQAGHVFGASAAHKHNIMLLQIVPLARDVRGHLFTIGQAYEHAFTIARVGFFRLAYDCLQHERFHLWLAVEYGLFEQSLVLLAHMKRTAHIHFP